MNQYKKKKNFLQTLFEFNWVFYCVTGVSTFLAIVVAPFFVGLLIMKIPGIPVTKDPCLVWLEGLCVIGICVAIVGIVLVLIPKVITWVKRDFHAAKIMQYLPLTQEDWAQFDAKTDEEAIRILRNLVKTIGFDDSLINCRELCNQIRYSYRAFLDFKYGYWNYLDIDDDVLANETGLVLCSDSKFDAKLKAERRNSKERRKQWIANQNK